MPRGREEFEHIARYRLESEIATGGMGVIWKAYDPEFKRTVAIKTIKPKLLEQAGFRERFEAEAEILGRLSHPNIVGAYDKGAQGKTVYTVMEYLQGHTLESLLQANSLPRLDKRLGIIEQLANGLNYIHENGVIHRDLSPRNIMLVDDKPVLIDFGIGKTADLELTDVGQFVGSYRYASPEQFTRSKAVSTQSDIFCLGIVAMLILTGHHPFDAPDINSTLFAITSEPPSISVPIGVPGDQWCTVFHKVFQKEPERRYKTALEFFAALKECYAIHNNADTPPFASSFHARPARKPVRVLRVLNGPLEGHAYPLAEKGISNIGRGKAAFSMDFDKFISETHAQVSYEKGLVAIKDLRSEHGTFVGGSRLSSGYWVEVNQLFVLGTTLLQVCDIDETALALKPTFADELSLQGTIFHNLKKYDFFGTNVIDSLSLFLCSLEQGDLASRVKEKGKSAGQLKEKVHSGAIFTGSESWINGHIRRNRGAFKANRLLLTPLASDLVKNCPRRNMLDAWMRGDFNLVHSILGVSQQAAG